MEGGKTDGGKPQFKLRSLTVDGEPRFLLQDVLKLMGLANNISTMARRLDEKDMFTEEVDNANGDSQPMTFITSFALLEAVYGSHRSRSEEIARFKEWIRKNLPQLFPKLMKGNTKNENTKSERGTVADDESAGADEDNLAEMVITFEPQFNLDDAASFAEEYQKRHPDRVYRARVQYASEGQPAPPTTEQKQDDVLQDNDDPKSESELRLIPDDQSEEEEEEAEERAAEKKANHVPHMEKALAKTRVSQMGAFYERVPKKPAARPMKAKSNDSEEDEVDEVEAEEVEKDIKMKLLDEDDGEGSDFEDDNYEEEDEVEEARPAHATTSNKHSQPTTTRATQPKDNNNNRLPQPKQPQQPPPSDYPPHQLLPKTQRPHPTNNPTPSNNYERRSPLQPPHSTTHQHTKPTSKKREPESSRSSYHTHTTRLEGQRHNNNETEREGQLSTRKRQAGPQPSSVPPPKRRELEDPIARISHRPPQERVIKPSSRALFSMLSGVGEEEGE